MLIENLSQKICKLETSSFRKIRKVRQLRALHYGARIHVEIACEDVPGSIDTEEDLLLFVHCFHDMSGFNILKSMQKN